MRYALFVILLACGNKPVETESVTTGEASPAAADSTTETTANKEGSVMPMSAPATTGGKAANATKPGASTASTSATVTFVTPVKTTVEYDDPETEEIPMDDHSEETDE